MTKIDPVSSALQGLLNAQDRLAQAAVKVSEGEVSAESLVSVKSEELNVKLQIKNVKIMAESEDEILDLLA